MKAAITILAILITCTQVKAQDVKKQTEAAKNTPTVTQDAGKADAWQSKQRRHQQIKDSSTNNKMTAVAPKKSKKHCGKP